MQHRDLRTRTGDTMTTRTGDAMQHDDTMRREDRTTRTEKRRGRGALVRGASAGAAFMVSSVAPAAEDSDGVATDGCGCRRIGPIPAWLDDDTGSSTSESGSTSVPSTSVGEETTVMATVTGEETSSGSG